MLPWQPIKFSDIDKIYTIKRTTQETFLNKKILITAVRQRKLPLFSLQVIRNYEISKQSDCWSTVILLRLVLRSFL